MNHLNQQIDQQFSIHPIKSIHPKLIRQLNYIQNIKFRRQQKKLKLFSKELATNQFDTFDKTKIIQPGLTTHSKKLKTQLNINGNIILGMIQFITLHGKKQVIFANGSKFKGRFLNGNMLQGRFQFKTGFIYNGGIMQNKFFGYGTLKSPSGKQISGQWNGQNIIGNGQIKYSTGQIYYGQIQNFKKNGFGYLFFKNKKKYIGNFKDGKISGKGSYYQNQKLIAEGIWQDGELVMEIPTQNNSLQSNQTNALKQSQKRRIFNLQKIEGQQHSQFVVNKKILQNSIKKTESRESMNKRQQKNNRKEQYQYSQVTSIKNFMSTVQDEY